MSPLQIDRPQRRVSNWVSGALVVALLLGSVVMGFLETKADLADGVEAPAWAFERFTGGQVSSATLQGRVVMIDFWATWCPPCVEEMPMLVRVAKDYEGRGVTFVAVSDDDEEQAKDNVTAFINHEVPGLRPFAAYGDPATSARFGVRALPTLYIVDRHGKIAGAQTGQVSERKVRAWLDRALLDAR